MVSGDIIEGLSLMKYKYDEFFSSVFLRSQLLTAMVVRDLCGLSSTAPWNLGTVDVHGHVCKCADELLPHGIDTTVHVFTVYNVCRFLATGLVRGDTVTTMRGSFLTMSFI